jgi:hypothetical protein
MGLRVDEHFDVAYPALMCPAQIAQRQVKVVTLLSQNGYVVVVEVEERLQVRELVPRREVVDIAVRKRDPIPFGQPEDCVGLQGALKVNMQFTEGEGLLLR